MFESRKFRKCGFTLVLCNCIVFTCIDLIYSLSYTSGSCILLVTDINIHDFFICYLHWYKYTWLFICYLHLPCCWQRHVFLKPLILNHFYLLFVLVIDKGIIFSVFYMYMYYMWFLWFFTNVLYVCTELYKSNVTWTNKEWIYYINSTL